jgi:hypothetical protein
MTRVKHPVVIKFVPVERVFKPQVKVRATRDLSGWANREKGVKWHIRHGRIGCMDADKAREFAAKGFVEILEGDIKPVSPAEQEEFLAQVTTISVGGPGG